MIKAKLPPLTALRAFEAAAKCRSFTDGANELGLTQTAVSHHVKNLEQHLQVALFVRVGRSVSLTPQGEILYDAARTGFQIISEAVDKIAPTTTSRTLVVSLMPHFSARWAIFRLVEFQKRFPTYHVRLHHNREAINFERDGVDIGVRWGPDTRPGIVSKELFGLALAPVASAAVAAQLGDNPSPEEIASHRLLQVSGNFNWESWLRDAGMHASTVSSALILDDYNVLISALLDSQGIGLCPILWVADLLKQGELTQLSPHTIRSDKQYHIVYQADREHQSKIRTFRDWMIEKSRSPFD